MSTADTLGTVFGIIGNVISFGLFLSPLPTFVTIYKKGVEQFSPIPYLATLFNCMMWVVYGMPFVHRNSILVVTVNSIGIFIEALYIAIFFVFAPRNLRKNIIGILVAELIFVGVILGGVLGGVLIRDKRVDIVGIICVIFGTAMHAPQITVMREVIHTKSVKNMPVDLYVVSHVNYFCWTVYSLLRLDFYFLVPNFLGALLIIVQIILFEPLISKAPNDKLRQNLELPVVTPTSAPDTISSDKV